MSFRSSLFGSKGPKASPLKIAFQKSRDQRNIDLIWPVFKRSALFAVVADDPRGDADGLFFRTRSPNGERWCVTVAEQEQWLESVPWPKRRMTGAELLQELGGKVEVVVVYPDGGDYITLEHLEWFAQLE